MRFKKGDKVLILYEDIRGNLGIIIGPDRLYDYSIYVPSKEEIYYLNDGELEPFYDFSKYDFEI